MASRGCACVRAGAQDQRRPAASGAGAALTPGCAALRPTPVLEPRVSRPGAGCSALDLSPCSPPSCVPQRPPPRKGYSCGVRGRLPRIRTSTCRTSTSGERPARAPQPVSFPRCPEAEGPQLARLPPPQAVPFRGVTLSQRPALAHKGLVTCQGLVEVLTSIPSFNPHNPPAGRRYCYYPILQTRKLREQEVMRLAQGRADSK